MSSVTQGWAGSFIRVGQGSEGCVSATEGFTMSTLCGGARSTAWADDVLPHSVIMWGYCASVGGLEFVSN